MPPVFTAYKKEIDTFLRLFLESKRSSFSTLGSKGNDFVDRMKDLVVAGKTIRGSLVLFAYDSLANKNQTDALPLAAAMELMQTALVVHDDIMDEDTVRRGKPALHVQYESTALAMCAADILFFLAFELVGTTKTDADTLGKIVRRFGREYQIVGLAQMDDVAQNNLTKQQQIDLFTNKTARYTFALPLMLGATLAGASKEQLRYFESYGVATGVLFQIRDDMLDGSTRKWDTETHAYTKAAIESAHRLPKNKPLIDLVDFVMTRTV